ARPRHAAPADLGRLPPGRIPPGRALAAVLAREDHPAPAFLPGRERRDWHAGRSRPRTGPLQGTRPAGAGDGPEQAAPGLARRYGPLLSWIPHEPAALALRCGLGRQVCEVRGYFPRGLDGAGNFAGSMRDRATPAASRTLASRSCRAACSAG